MYTWTVNAFIDAVGEEKAYDILSRHGGTPVYISRLDIPEEAKTKLRERFSDPVMLPKADQIIRSERNRRIISLRKTTSIPALALKFNLTTRQIHSIISDYNQNGEAFQADPRSENNLSSKVLNLFD